MDLVSVLLTAEMVASADHYVKIAVVYDASQTVKFRIESARALPLSSCRDVEHLNVLSEDAKGGVVIVPVVWSCSRINMGKWVKVPPFFAARMCIDHDAVNARI